ncbi:MAG: hypothetical protein KJ799_00225 [Bacteroidetes bacterium]|nr:hypothetical protein [Bacteroidota bacterium]
MKKLVIAFLITVAFFAGCSVYKTIMNVSRLSYKLETVGNFKVSGISFDKKAKISDIGTMDYVKLTSAFASGKLPVSFTVNIAAKNPNDGSGGFPPQNITIEEFPWELELNGVKTISGRIGAPINVPGVGESTIIPLTMELDLIEFFGKGGINELLDIALKLGGKNQDITNVKIIANPVLGTPIGKLSYPGPLTIVNQNFN